MINLPSYVAGVAFTTDRWLTVTNPWNDQVVGRVSKLSLDHLNDLIAAHQLSRPRLSRYERSQILLRTRQLLEEHRDSLARLITAESGLCLRDTRLEVQRACDVFSFSAMEALRDDGQIFDCDISQLGKARKIFTVREPLSLGLAITPFNFPLNQVAHKVAPAIAAGTPLILKPSEKTPLTAVRLTELLYEAGLPGWMLSCVHGDLDQVTHPLITDQRIEMITFTGSVPVGKQIAAKAGYKKLCLELGGHSPMIVMADADLELAAKLACEGSFRQSGQRCTAIRRLLVERPVIQPFTKLLLETARSYTCGDPADESTIVGTVINRSAAEALEAAVQTTLAQGAKLLLGGERQGAQFTPTILTDVPRQATLCRQECFGPIVPIIAVENLDEALQLANDTSYGLAAAIVTQNLQAALRAVREIKAGAIHVNEIPAYRLETSPFGGIKDSGLGVKEGVIEAIKFMTNVKTFSLPW
jgi:putative phosphonoacetaldehyde dehydrogenase